MPEPKRIHTNYSGLVKAEAPTHYGHLREVGEVWEVKDLKLWNDDPFIPVKVKLTSDGETVHVPYEEGEGPPVGDMHSRKLIVDQHDSTALRKATV